MANRTEIEWTDFTINPIIGCTKCSPGCDLCYAERRAWRLAHNPATSERYSRVITHGNWNGKIDVDFSCFRKLSNTSMPRRIFVGSMGDSFHESMDASAIFALFQYMQIFSRHTFLLLTKRPSTMRHFMNLEFQLQREDDAKGVDERAFTRWPLPNVWLGVTVCNQQEADGKIPLLLSTPAAKRFISIEPMLGPIKVTPYIGSRTYHCACGWHDTERDLFLVGEQAKCHNCGKLANIYPALDWVIVGGETGNGHRDMNPDWARTIRDQCKAAKVPYFIKALSGRKPIPSDLLIREFPNG